MAIRHPDRSLAHQIAGYLTNLSEPPPDALTIFESGPGWLIEAYYEAPPEDEAAIVEVLASALEIDVPTYAFEIVPDANWVAISQAALPPVFAGRFTVFGSHDLDRIGRGWTRLQIDAGEAFGTAHHATTYGCLSELGRLSQRHRFHNVLDLGTGSGVLALALQRAQPHARIIATDLDLRSIEVARDNATVNALTGPLEQRLQFHCAAGLDAVAIRSRAPFDLVIANILAGPLILLAPSIVRHTRPGSSLILSGILVPQAAQVIARYRALGFVLVAHQRYEEWATLTFSRRD
ncbi:MAG: 50S ribosomal protein L11 methyltransferase [Hyphomicrobiaceae bacterium]|nr:50S ribosomal protein L11 methyltransferase [Hyphomicrobiaceae bacterium]